MAEGNYQVIFSGNIIDGAELDMVKRNVARVFKLDAEQVEKLFCGRRLILKKQIDQDTAEKYQAMMQRAGAICEVQNIAQAQKPTAPVNDALPETASSTTTPSEAISEVDLAEPGVTLIEHVEVPEANIDISGMDMAEVGIELIEHEVVPEANIDISGIDMAEVGIQLVEHEVVPEADIDVSGMDMAEVGIQLVAPKDIPEPEFDTSSMSLDVTGAQLVETKEIPPANIDTSHLTAE